MKENIPHSPTLPRTPEGGADPPRWSRERLQRLVAERLEGSRLIVVGNREPYIHAYTPGGVRCVEPDSGVVSALDPVLRATGGTWIAHGGGSADRETADAAGRLRVPPGEDLYTLRRVWLSKEEEEGYYYGVSNEALWPLCHIAYQRPVFEESDWDRYVKVNEKFADAVVAEAGGARPLVFIQDYHFALLPKLVKERLPGAVVFQFWHIPWPNPEVFRVCPWRGDLLRGLLGNDLLAFHIQYHCNNFMDTVDRELEARLDRERFTVTMRGSTTLLRPHPISVDFDGLSALASSPATRRKVEALRKEFRLDGRRVLLSVGRMDYTKGIVERLRSLDRMLGRYPEWAGKFVHLEVAIPSRSHLRPYQRLHDEVEALVEEINWRHRTHDWDPIVLIREHQGRESLVALYALADVCLVSSLHDGMNLVAKEYVACRVDGRGVLVLSHFTGAARELIQAVPINPYAVDRTAETFHAALRMPEEEQEGRMSRLRQTVAEHNVFRWAGKLLGQAARIELT